MPVFEGEQQHEVLAEECRQCLDKTNEMEKMMTLHQKEMQELKDQYEAKIHKFGEDLNSQVKEKEWQRTTFRKELAVAHGIERRLKKELHELKEKYSLQRTIVAEVLLRLSVASHKVGISNK